MMGLADYYRRQVAILTPHFVSPMTETFDIGTCQWGGGERYIIDLASLLTERGHSVALYQASEKPWTGVVKGFTLHGVGAGGRRDRCGFHPKTAEAFRTRVADNYDLCIYMNIDVSIYANPNSIAVTHGIFWDSFKTADLKWTDKTWLNSMYSAHMNPKLVVSVDTNSINWVRAVFGTDTASRMRYIPNYADAGVYRASKNKPVCQGVRTPGKTVVLFARRLSGPRGIDPMLQAATSILDDSSMTDVVFRFVGKGSKVYEDHIRALGKRFPDRCSYAIHEMDGMEQEYWNADISVIPTLACEGTSLTAIESMAAGCVTIATRVGGLTDLVLDGHNGLLVHPSAGEIEAAVRLAITDKDLSTRLSKMGRTVFEESFTKERWKSQWVRVLSEVGEY